MVRSPGKIRLLEPLDRIVPIMVIVNKVIVLHSLIIKRLPIQQQNNTIKSMSIHKVCITCGEEKTIFEFPNNKNSRDGLLNTCKECQRAKCLAYYRTHREERCAKHREWARKNKEHCNEYQKAVKHRYRKRVNSYMQRRRAEEPIWYYSTRLFYPIRYVLNKRGNCVSKRAEEITGLPADKLFEYQPCGVLRPKVSQVQPRCS